DRTVTGVQTCALPIWRQQLAGVRGTDGDGQIGERQSALEDVHPAVPLEHPWVVQVTRQTQCGQGLRREVPLKPGVVHREHRGQRSEEHTSELQSPYDL